MKYVADLRKINARRIFTAGYIKSLENNFRKDPVYMAKFERCKANTPACDRWYRVVGPVAVKTKRLDGTVWTTSSFDNELLGKIVRPIEPTVGCFCPPGFVWYWVFKRIGKTNVRRERIGVAGLELKEISRGNDFAKMESEGEGTGGMEGLKGRKARGG